ncbi:MAG TPA: trypsin-like peptidase domain-containing protein [Solirubrobacteraceae bacterium]|nr:trypsin-like peptidase domain-containing protein [Solirubrobacteraceae bacterium]
MRRLAAAAVLATALGGAAGCGGDGGDEPRQDTVVRTVTSPPERAPAAGLPEGRFDPAAIFRRGAPGVVTVISVFRGRRSARGLGSGFVLDGEGEVATNAHVVTEGQGRSSARADEVYVQFADGNQVAARVVGTDPDYDVALLRVRRDSGVRLTPLPLGSSAQLVVGQPVAAIGSPFGERQSLSVGVISAVDRTIESLTRFQIPDAIQTDAAVNRGNSGGPLLDARGRVIGINSQIRTAGGGSEGVGFAVPIDTVKRSLAQLRQDGRAEYPYVGVSTVALYPQLARRLGLDVGQGAVVQEVVDGGPADDAGIRAGTQRIRFQGEAFRGGGDVIVALGGRPVREESDLARALIRHRAGEQVDVVVVRGDDRRTVKVRLAKRP